MCNSMIFYIAGQQLGFKLKYIYFSVELTLN